MNYFIFFISIFLISLQLNAAVKLISPANESIIYGRNIPFIIRGCKTMPSSTMKINNQQKRNLWKKTNYKKQWNSFVNLENNKNYSIQLNGKCKNKSFSFNLQVNTNFNYFNNSIDQLAFTFINNNKPNKLAWDWSPAIFLYGLAKYAHKSQYKTSFINYVHNYHNHFVKNDLPNLNWADRCPSALSGLELLKSFNNKIAIPNIQKVINFLKTTKKNSLGSINHFGTNSWMARIFPQSIWVDSLMMWAVLAVQFGDLTKDNDLLEFGLKQPLIFANKMRDLETGLFFHAWNIKKNRPFPKRNTFWLRGNAWVLTALIEMIDIISPNNLYYPKLVQLFQSLAQSALNYQQPNGMWDTLISSPGSAYEESSGTALLAYAYHKGHRLNLLEKKFQDASINSYTALTARLFLKGENRIMGEISWLTMPYSKLGYKLIPRKKNLAFGVGSLLLLASEMQ